jgi:hypothetical protein
MTYTKWSSTSWWRRTLVLRIKWRHRIGN